MQNQNNYTWPGFICDGCGRDGLDSVTFMQEGNKLCRACLQERVNALSVRRPPDPKPTLPEPAIERVAQALERIEERLDILIDQLGAMDESAEYTARTTRGLPV